MNHERIDLRLKQQYRTDVFIELAILVLGVFIGMQAESRKQARPPQVEWVVSPGAVTRLCLRCGKLWPRCQGGLMHV